VGIGATTSDFAAGESPEIGVGMLGYAFMGKAHSNAFRKIAYMTWPPPLVPRLVAIAGRNAEAVWNAATRYGYERATTDWRDLVSDPAIGLFDNGGPNSMHAEPTIAAAEAGKHVLCEKPPGRTADESFEIWQRVAATGVKHLCAFNYRFVPAVRFARELIDAGELGEIRHFRGRYLQDWGDDPALDTWRFHADEAGSGAFGDLGAHVVDLARYLVGEIASVSALVKTFLPGRQVDDAIEPPSSSRAAR
jgi:predicted dehydrogenase